MKYFVLVWAGLWRKPTRTILTSLSVATAFLLYGALNGTMVSFDKWIGQATGDVAILWTSSRVNLSAGLPLGIVPIIERIDGVAAVDIERPDDVEDPDVRPVLARHARREWHPVTDLPAVFGSRQ